MFKYFDLKLFIYVKSAYMTVEMNWNGIYIDGCGPSHIHQNL